MDRYDLALLTLLRALLSRRGSAVLADRTGLPGAVAEILAEKTDDDIRGILLSAHRLAAGSADRLSLLGELACLLPELSESMMRSAPKESAPATDPYALVLSSDGDISAEVRERILKGDITKLVINYSLNCRNGKERAVPLLVLRQPPSGSRVRRLGSYRRELDVRAVPAPQGGEEPQFRPGARRPQHVQGLLAP